MASYLHLPTLASLWQTSYGQAILVKVALLLVAVALASVNLLRTKPGLRAERTGAAGLLRRLVAGEVAIVAAAIFAAAILSSLAPPSKALATDGHASAHVGPGPVTSGAQKSGYRLELRVTPNKAAVPNDFSVRLSRNGKRVTGADIVIRVSMLDMEMGDQEYRLSETAPGVYTHAAPALVMVGHWGLSFNVTPRGSTQPFDVLIVDHATG